MATRVHISLGVTDLDRSLAFYRQLLGSEPSRREEDYANFRLDEPPIHLALVASRDSAPPHRTEHFGVEVFSTEALASWRQRLEASGLVERVEEAETCCYAVSDKVWATDPDGHRWEVWHRLGDAASLGPESTAMPERAAAEAECCPPSCCAN